MNKYVRKLFGAVFQGQQAQQVIRIQPQYSPAPPKEWRQYWQAKGFPWRTEPEIDTKRQEELTKCRAIAPDIKKGIYPFKGMKLSRADVEWLLATHENGRGPIDWSDESQRKRQGLDLRGADLRQLNLHGLPLNGVLGGLTGDEWVNVEGDQQIMMAAAQLDGTLLMGAQLNGAYLIGTLLNKSNLVTAQLNKACLIKAQLNSALIAGAELNEAALIGTQLERANLMGVQLKHANLMGAQLQRTNLSLARLEGANLAGTKLSDEKQVGPRLADAHLDGINLAVVRWSQIKMLGDEYFALQQKDHRKVKDKATRLDEYEQAVRANRQLAVALQDQGLSEDAARFAYRAQILQRKVLWKQRNFWKWLGSAILALLAGYGYHMWRIIVAYLLIVLLCAGAYFVLGIYYEPHLSILEAMLTSITAFHGRVFSEPFLRPGEPQLWVTAFEAVVGLVIEGVFIAMLTQKFFGK